MELKHRRIEGNFSQGWGMALFIVLLVASAFGTAFWIHKTTYRSPRDVTAPYRKQEKAKTGATVAEITPQR